MPEPLGPLPLDAIPIRDLIINGQIIPVYEEDIVLPSSFMKQVLCIEDLKDGTDEVVLNRFLHEGGCYYPLGEEDSIVRFRLECAGRRLLGKCGLQIVQYDRQGNPLEA